MATPYIQGSPSTTPTSAPPTVSTETARSLRSCLDAFSSWGRSERAPGVCGESDDGWECASSVGFADARTTCEGVGARLCSTAEVVPAAKGTGCGHDNRYVWTATACDDGHVRRSTRGTPDVRAKGNNAGDTQCAQDGDAAAVRCCADHEFGSYGNADQMSACNGYGNISLPDPDSFIHATTWNYHSGSSWGQVSGIQVDCATQPTESPLMSPISSPAAPSGSPSVPLAASPICPTFQHTGPARFSSWSQARDACCGQLCTLEQLAAEYDRHGAPTPLLLWAYYSVEGRDARIDGCTAHSGSECYLSKVANTPRPHSTIPSYCCAVSTVAPYTWGSPSKSPIATSPICMGAVCVAPCTTVLRGDTHTVYWNAL
eukprot:gene58331-biopygen94569